jgi:hypothetical protein
MPYTFVCLMPYALYLLPYTAYALCRILSYVLLMPYTALGPMPDALYFRMPYALCRITSVK